MTTQHTYKYSFTHVVVVATEPILVYAEKMYVLNASKTIKQDFDARRVKFKCHLTFVQKTFNWVGVGVVSMSLCLNVPFDCLFMLAFSLSTAYFTS